VAAVVGQQLPASAAEGVEHFEGASLLFTHFRFNGVLENCLIFNLWGLTHIIFLSEVV
jgi:hypothetical protein